MLPLAVRAAFLSLSRKYRAVTIVQNSVASSSVSSFFRSHALSQQKLIHHESAYHGATSRATAHPFSFAAIGLVFASTAYVSDRNFAECDAISHNSQTATRDDEYNNSETDNQFIEPITKVPYPLRLSEKEQLVGVGVRLMTPLKFQVYTVGLYVDEKTVESMLHDWRGKGPNFEPLFWKELTSPAIPLQRTFRMTVVRDVSGKHLQHGFDKALIPRVRRAASDMNMPGGKDALRKFNAIFKSAGTLAVGTNIDIKFDGYDMLTLEINEKPQLTLRNEALVWAILDMFLGQSPVAPNVKEQFANGFSALLSS